MARAGPLPRSSPRYHPPQLQPLQEQVAPPTVTAQDGVAHIQQPHPPATVIGDSITSDDCSAIESQGGIKPRKGKIINVRIPTPIRNHLQQPPLWSSRCH